MIIKKILNILLIVIVSLILNSCMQEQNRTPSVIYKENPIKGKMIDCNFYPGDSFYHAIIHASDGNIYYAICTHDRNTNVHMFRYNPKTGSNELIADIGKVFGEDATKTLPQGKIHVDFYEHNKKLYFTTHCGLYERGGSVDHGPYPGGHFASYDLTTGAFDDYGIGEKEEGLITMIMDKERGRLYALTFPSGIFIYYDIDKDRKKSFGPSVVGYKYIPKKSVGNIPRSLGLDPRSGNVYWWNADETVSTYNYEGDSIQVLTNHDLGRPIFKVHKRGSVERKVSWRSIRWNETDSLFYGNTFYGEYLFSYDPLIGTIEVIDRIAPGPNRKSGELAGGSLAFELSKDGTTLYYVNNISPYTLEVDKKEIGEIHLVTYNIPLRKYIDHGPIVLEDGRKPVYSQGIEIGRDGNIYMVCVIPWTDFESEKGKALKEIRHKATPTEHLKQVYEVNLVIIKNPIK